MLFVPKKRCREVSRKLIDECLKDMQEQMNKSYEEYKRSQKLNEIKDEIIIY
ncbi:hypothetical protein [Methanobrevibacter sp.]|uniref:hypothetical protein n=1 Tax=Methanobrevibacter sp. TaxID=66852 RepID=UPI0026DF790D|nr:hypothetical protein [Methanobrevibacter sp.]MDO5859878.1 hypothetical protein [Methanobrevibacter sp.]